MSGFNTFPAYLALSARAGGTPRIWLGSPVYWACQIVGWGIYAANDLTNARRDHHLSVGAELSQTAWFFAVCLLVSHLLRVAILREEIARLEAAAKTKAAAKGAADSFFKL